MLSAENPQHCQQNVGFVISESSPCPFPKLKKLPLVYYIASVFSVPVPYLFVEQECTQSNERISLVQLKILEDELRENLNSSLTKFFSERRLGV